MVSSLACAPTSLGQNASSTCTVTLTQAAPTGGASVALTNSNATLTVPPSVTVAAAATSATFSATTTTIASNQSATLTATYNGTSANTSLSLLAPVMVSSLACNPTTLGSNCTSTCTVTLTQGAPAGGSQVTISDNSAALSTPASVTVGAGAATATFAAKAGVVTANTSVTIKAALSGHSATAVLTLTPATTPDTTPPSMPMGLSAIPVSLSQINLAWTASTDNVGVTGYQVFRNNNQIATTASNAYSDRSVVPGIQYTYAVSAFDASGNSSALSPSVIAETSSAPDITPPSVPTGLQSSNVTATALTLTWSASTDNVAVTGYRVFRNGAQVGTTAVTSYADTGLTPSTAYAYTVAAYDGSNNASAQSVQLSVTTALPALTPPTFIQVNNNQISSGTHTSVTFNAPTQAGNTIVAYVIWSNTNSVALTDSRGNAFVNIGSPVSWGSGNRAQIFYASNIAGGTDTVTATFGAPVASFGVVYVHEYAGISAINPVDVTASASGSSPSLNSGSVTTTSVNDLIFAAGVSDNTVTASGSGFAARDLAYGNITEDRAASTIGSYAATAIHNGSAWGIQIVAFHSGN